MIERLHTDRFDFSAKTQTFVADASELGWKPGLIPIEIALTSGRTGKVTNFTLELIEEDGSLKFEAWNPTLKALGVKIHVIND
jgi:hypothetical protein